MRCREPGLARLAKIVHAADIAEDVESDPLGPGLLAVCLGSLEVEPDDNKLLERESFVYDALFEWCRKYGSEQN